MSVHDSEFFSLGKIPSRDSIIRDSLGQKIEKLCGQSEWQTRTLYVTSDKLLVEDPRNEGEISDEIPLVLFLKKRFAFILSSKLTCPQSMKSNHQIEAREDREKE